MDYLIIMLLVTAIVTTCALYVLTKKENEHREEDFEFKQPKFQPRKITYVITEKEVEKPKRKYKKRKPKAKPDVAENAPVQKRPVGRPRKNTE